MSDTAAARDFGDSFGGGAARIAGQVGLLLGWSPDRFWQATPEELRAVLGAAGSGGAGGDGAGAIDRATISAMMERDRHG
ncbi:phage tail assembly chaperone [Novosphingobium olei]|uniref:phage tail assembly chaperone n=1 Tax=Novosphingobium olei TaxID=2728851 RepID=UPI0030863839|nr:phage tail assembly chaperone [Novosphingobium olei]